MIESVQWRKIREGGFGGREIYFFRKARLWDAKISRHRKNLQIKADCVCEHPTAVQGDESSDIRRESDADLICACMCMSTATI